MGHEICRARYQRLLLGVAFVHLTAAVRSSDDEVVYPEEVLCTQATPDPEHRWRFLLNNSQSRGVRHHDHYVLREKPDCGGPELAANVSVIPHIDPFQPLESSSVVITVEPNYTHDRFYICHKVLHGDACLAGVILQKRPFRPRQLLLSVPFLSIPSKDIAVLLGKPRPCLDVLEWAMCFILICLPVLALKSLCTYRRMGRDEKAKEPELPASDQPTKDELECPISIPSPNDKFDEAWDNGSTFVVAIYTMVSGLLSILVSSNGPAWLIFLTVFWPATFGNLLMYLFWMSTYRLQLFSAALSQEICIQGEHPGSRWLSPPGGALSVMLFLCAWAALRSCWKGSSTTNEIEPLLVSPAMSLNSIVLGLFCARMACHSTKCEMSIQAMARLMGKISTEKSEQRGETQLPEEEAGIRLARRVRDGSVAIIPEGSFCQLCRDGRDPVEAIRSKEPLPEEGKTFSILDIAWHSRIVHQLSGERKAVFNTPCALGFILALLAMSWQLALTSTMKPPTIADLAVSKNSLGKFHPELRLWQTDYELVLDWYAHSVTFQETLSKDGTRGLDAWHRPVGEPENSSQPSAMVTALSNARSPFPDVLWMNVSGILGRTTQYSVQIVTDLHLFPGVRIVPLKNGSKLSEYRLFSGEVRGSSLSLPEETTDVEITIYQDTYSMAVPVSWEEANQDNASMLTVYVAAEEIPWLTSGNETNTEACRKWCRREQRCVFTRVGWNGSGCFEVWGPMTLGPSAFNFSTLDTKNHSLSCNHLGVRLCVEEDWCFDMERGEHGVLQGTLPFHVKRGVEFIVSASTYQTRDCNRGKSYVYNPWAELSFTRHIVLPTEILVGVPGVNTSIARRNLEGEEEATEVTVTLDEYVPRSAALVLYFAVLVSDPRPQIQIPSSFGTLKPVCRQDSDWQLEDLWDVFAKECLRTWKKAKDYSVCLGWRHSHIVRCDLEAWSPWIEEHIHLTSPCSSPQCEIRNKIVVRTKTKSGAHPAEWSLEKNDCSLDFRALDDASADDLFTPRVFMTACATCPSVRVLMQNYTRKWSLEEFMKQAVKRGPGTGQLVALLDSIAKSDFVDHKAATLRDMGFHLDDDGDLCFDDETGRSHVYMEGIIEGLRWPWKPGLIEYALDLYNASQIQESVGLDALLTATRLSATSANRERERREELVSVISTYIKRRVKYVHLSSETTSPASPALWAIKYNMADVLDHILQVTTCCYQVADQYANQTFWEFGIASGCPRCLQALKSRCGAVNRTGFFFSTPTRADTWAELADVAKAFHEVPTISTLGFVVVTQDAFRRTLAKVRWLARQGTFKGLTELYFAAQEPLKLNISPEAARLLCDVIHAQPQLQKLFVAGDVNPSTNRTLVQCLRESGHSEGSLTVWNPPTGRLAQVIQHGVGSKRPRCIPEANTTAVVAEGWLDFKKGGVGQSQS